MVPYFRWNEGAVFASLGSSLKRLYWMKLINAYTQRGKEREIEKESGRVAHSSSRNFENSKFMRYSGRLFLVKYSYICIRFLKYEVLFWQLKLVSTICIFVVKIRLLYSSFFSFVGYCWFYRSWFMINSKVYGIIISLNWILKQILHIWWSKPLILIPGQLIEYNI